MRKKLVIAGFVLCLVVFGIVMLVRQRSAPVQRESKRYPHEHLQASELEPNAQLNQINYTLRNGETLAAVAKLRYGHQNYYRVIKLYNHLADEGQVPADSSLRLPEMSAILAEEGVTKVAAEEVALILCSRAKYHRVVKQLWALHAEPGDQYQLPEDVRRELFEAADDLQQATESLKQTRAGVTAVPQHTIAQLEQNMTSLRNLAQGEHDSYGYDIDIIQQRYALALAYAIIWAREGFK